MITMRRVKDAGQDTTGDWETNWEDMEIPVKRGINFMKTDIDNQLTAYQKLREEISSFSLPTGPQRLPITAVRRIVSQLLIPKISQKLRLQPISWNQADLLDHHLAAKIHAYYQWVSKVPTDVLLLSVSDHGFEFPSIADINAAVTIKGINRDLNHQLPGIKLTAQITLQDWSCVYNSCKSPLICGQGQILATTDTPANIKHQIPSAWATAVAYMSELKVSLVNTDQSYVLRGCRRVISEETVYGECVLELQRGLHDNITR
jgi:hypothetical protein